MDLYTYLLLKKDIKALLEKEDIIVSDEPINAAVAEYLDTHDIQAVAVVG